MLSALIILLTPWMCRKSIRTGKKHRLGDRCLSTVYDDRRVTGHYGADAVRPADWS